MKCPHSFNRVYYGTQDQGFTSYNCREKECGHWDKVSKQCYVLSDLELKRKILQALKNMGVK